MNKQTVAYIGAGTAVLAAGWVGLRLGQRAALKRQLDANPMIQTLIKESDGGTMASPDWSKTQAAEQVRIFGIQGPKRGLAVVLGTLAVDPAASALITVDPDTGEVQTTEEAEAAAAAGEPSLLESTGDVIEKYTPIGWGYSAARWLLGAE